MKTSSRAARVKAIAIVVAFLLPAFAALLATEVAATHATANQPTKPLSVLGPWTPVEDRHNLYLRATPSDTPTDTVPKATFMAMGRPTRTVDAGTDSRTYSLTSAAPGQARTVVTFTSMALAHDVTLSNYKSDSLGINERPQVEFYFRAPSGTDLVFKANLKELKPSGATDVAVNEYISNGNGTRTNITALGAPNVGVYKVTADLLVLPTHTVVDRNSQLVLEVAAYTTVAGPLGGSALTATTWTVLFDAAQYPTHLSLFSRDALQVSTWMTNVTGSLQSNNVFPVFERASENVAHGFLAVKSAFASNLKGNAEDLTASNVDVRFGVYSVVNGVRTALDLQHNSTDPAGVQSGLRMTLHEGPEYSEGYAVYKSTFHFGDSHLPAGDYRLGYTLAMLRNTLPQGEVGYNTELAFTVTKVTFAFGLWPGESSGHTISNKTSGVKSTTFVLNLTNLGASQDVITLTRSGPHTAGWTVGGDLVQDRVSIDLRAMETRRIIVTLTAPSNAKANDFASLNVTAKGTFDPKPYVIPLAATLTQSDPQRDVSLIIDTPSKTIKTLTEEAVYDVFVWNRGTGPENFTVTLTKTLQKDWRYSPDTAQRLNSVGAGELRLVRVTVKTPLAGLSTDDSFGLTVRAEVTQSTVSAAQRTLTTLFKVTPSFDFKVFNPTTKQMQDSASMVVRGGCIEIGSGTSVPDPSETEDHQYKQSCDEDLRAPAWIVHRLWITNTGPVTSSYRLTMGALSETNALNQPASPPTFFQSSTLPAGFGTVAYQVYPTQPYGDITYPAKYEVPASEKSDFGYYDDRGQWVKLTDNLLSNVPPGATVETFVKVRNDISTILERKLDFTVTATETSQPPSASKERKVGLHLERAPHAGANTASLNWAFHAELAQRATDYASSHIVKTVPTVQYVNPGKTTEFVFRVTDLANFVSGQYSGGFTNQSLNLSIVGTIPAGWEVDMRNMTQKAGQPVDWKKGMDFLTPEQREHTHAPNDPNADKYHHAYVVSTDKEIVVRVKAPENAQVNIDQLPLLLRVKAHRQAILLDKPDTELFYSFKTVVGAAVGLEMTAPTLVDVKTGNPNTYSITLKNTGSRTLDLLLSKELTTETGLWTVTFSDALLVLRPGEKQTVTATVQFPNTQAGVTRSIFFSACESTGGSTTCPTSSTLARKEVRHRILEQSAVRITYDVLEQHLDLQNSVGVDDVTFRFNVTNQGSTPLRVELRVVPNMTDTEWARNWSIVLTPGNLSRLGPGERAGAQLIVRALKATPGSAYPFTVTAHAFFASTGDSLTPGRPADLLTFTATTRAGTPAPQLLPDELERSVDRNGFVRIPMRVQNTGPVDGNFPLTVDLEGAPLGWRARIESEFGRAVPISNITVRTGATQMFYVNISAPSDVAPGTKVTATVNAYRKEGSAGFSSRTLTTVIHDYAFRIQMPSSPVWIEPGKKHEFRFNVTNLGNGWDNISFVPSLPNEDNTTWGRLVDLPNGKLELKPGERKEVILRFEPPMGNTAGKTWVTSGARAFTLHAWSTDARKTQTVLNVSEKATVTLQVYNYRHDDVDGDGVEELAIDLDRNTANGYETFRESPLQPGRTTTKVIQRFDAHGTGKTTFILDTGRSDMTANRGDRFWDPEEGTLTNVTAIFEVNGKPVYLFSRSGLVNVNGNLVEEVDTAFFSGVDASEQVRRAVRKNIVHTDLREYVIFSAENEDVPVLYFSLGADSEDASDDVQTAIEVATDKGSSGLYGIRTDPNSNTATHYFDVEQDSIQGATTQNVQDFAKEFWYFFALFGLVLVVGVGVLVNRVRAKQE